MSFEVFWNMVPWNKVLWNKISKQGKMRLRMSLPMPYTGWWQNAEREYVGFATSMRHFKILFKSLDCIWLQRHRIFLVGKIFVFVWFQSGYIRRISDGTLNKHVVRSKMHELFRTAAEPKDNGPCCSKRRSNKTYCGGVMSWNITLRTRTNVLCKHMSCVRDSMKAWFSPTQQMCYASSTPYIPWVID